MVAVIFHFLVKGKGDHIRPLFTICQIGLSSFRFL